MKPMKLMLGQILKVAANEFCIAVLLGALPCFIMYSHGGIPGLKEFTSSSTPDSILIWYMGALVIASLLCGAVSRLVYSPSDAMMNSMRWAAAISHEVGLGFLGILRVLVGVLVGLLVLWILFDKSTVTAERITKIVIYSIIGLAECVFLFFLHHASKREFKIKEL